MEQPTKSAEKQDAPLKQAGDKLESHNSPQKEKKQEEAESSLDRLIKHGREMGF